MNYDVTFFELLTDARNEILRRSSELRQLQKDLANMEADKNHAASFGATATSVDIDVAAEELRDLIGETYLSIQYGQELYADLTAQLAKVQFLTAFINEPFDRQSFNLTYEEQFQE